jgi:putative ABC transport system substrate-binding protein
MRIAEWKNQAKTWREHMSKQLWLRSRFRKVLKSAIRNPQSAILLCALLFALCGAAEAQQPKKIYRIGYLSGTDPATDSPRSEAIRRGLRELGYMEGQNIVFVYRYAGGKRNRAAELAAELVRLNVDLIVAAGGDPWIRAVGNATKTIPIVLEGQGSDPVKAGFAESLARPGGNITGFTSLTTNLGGKRLELLKEAAPKLARVAVLHDPTTVGATRELKEDLPVAARALELTMRAWEVRVVGDFDKVFAALNNHRPDGLYVSVAGPLIRPNVKRIANFALKSRMPSLYTSRVGTDAGGLMYYGADDGERYRRVAIHIDKILKGAKPADLPVEQPTKFEFIINLKAAKQIGLTIPPNLLARADRVIR